MKQAHVLLTGDLGHEAFRDAIDWLAAHVSLTQVAGLKNAAVHLALSPTPTEIVVIAQSRPGQFSSLEVEQLHRASPLSRLLALLGSWCEGETRSGDPWPGVRRVYWHQCVPHFEAQLERWRAGDGRAPWMLPRTTSPTELALDARSQSPQRVAELIAVHTESALAFDVLGDACRSAGYSVVWLRPDQFPQVLGPAAIIWDGTSPDAAEMARLRELANRFDNSPVVALLGFPRLADVRRVIKAGAATALAKPILIDELYAEIRRVTRIAQADASRRSAA